MARLTRRQRVSAIVLASIALCFLVLDVSGGALGGAHAGVRGALGSLYRGTDTVLGPARRWAEGVPDAGTNEQQIDRLRTENAALRGQVASLQADSRTGAALSRLQRAADGRTNRLLPTRVIALGPGEGFDWTVTVDVGSHRGVRAGQTVTDGVGLVGRVLHADADSAVVLLAADPGSGIGVRDLRTGEVGVATGAGTSGFTFTPLNPNATVEVGDQLATGPTGSTSYVAGLSVGTVRAVHTAAGATTTATVAAAVSPTAVDVVAVILNGPDPGLADQAPR